MAEIDKIQCLGVDANTGIARCVQKPGLIKMSIAVPKGTYVTNTDMADPATFILGKIRNDNPAARWYPLPQYVGIEVNNTEAGTQTFAYGATIRVGEDKSSWTFPVIDGGQCGYDAIRKFHKKHEEYDFYKMDAQGQLMGHTRIVSGAKQLYAYSFEDIYVPTWKPGTNTATADYRISFMFEDDSQLADRFGLVQTGLDLGELLGVNTVNLELVGSVGTSGTVTVRATTACGGANMGDLFGSTLAHADAWILVATDDGLEIPLTGVSYNSTTKLYTIDPDQTNANYDIGDDILLKFEPIADLVALGVAYYETPTGLTYTAN